MTTRFRDSAIAIADINRELLRELSFVDENAVFEWIKKNGSEIRSPNRDRLSLRFIAMVLEVEDLLRGFNIEAIERKCSAYGNYLENKHLIDDVDFKNLDVAFEWIKDNRDKIKSKEKKKGTVSLRYIADILDVAGVIEGIDLLRLQRKCSAYENYLENKELIDSLKFRDIDSAFEFLLENRSLFRSKEDGKELSLIYIVDVLQIAGAIEGSNYFPLQIKCGAYDNYLENRDLIDEVEFKDLEDAFEWIKENRKKMKSKKKDVEKISSRYLVTILEVAGKLSGICIETLERRCSAYDNYLDNKELVDALEFKDTSEAFEWIKGNRHKIKSKEKGKELSLGYIVTILEAGGKITNKDAQALRMLCGAFDNYLENKDLMDVLEFWDLETAFEWIKKNRKNVKAKIGSQLSLIYIATILEVAGKLRGFSAQQLKMICGAYDFFKAKEHFFVAAMANYFKENKGAELSDFIKWCMNSREYPTATIWHSVKGKKPISRTYLRTILQSAKNDLAKHFDRMKEMKFEGQSDITFLRESYKRALKAIAKKEKEKKIDRREMFSLIRRKRREVKLALSAFRTGAKLEKKAFRKISSAA
jgi:phage terminase small subunit